MDALQAFLDSDLEVTKDVELERLGAVLTFKPLKSKELRAMTQRATHGKELDNDKLSCLVISKSCVNLNFGDGKMLEKFGASDAVDCVEKALFAGEITTLGQEIMKLSGFGNLGEQVAKAKK